MFKNEDDFKTIVNRLNIDDEPNPAHRESLRGQMLSAFNENQERTQTGTRPLWRTIVKSPIGKLAAAAVIIIAVLFGIHMIGGSNSIAFADVLEQVRDFRPYSCTVTSQYEGKPTVTRHVMNLNLQQRREVYTGGYVQIFDLSQNPVKMLAVDPEKKLAIEKMSPGIKSGRNFDLLRHLSLFENMPDKFNVEDLGGRRIEGQKAKGFHVPGKNNDWTIWADAQTGLPIRIELIHPKIGQKITMSKFEFDVDFDESLFELKAPQGYAFKQILDPIEQDMIEGLEAVARFLGGEFPSVFEFRGLQKVLREYIEENNVSVSEDQMQSLGNKLSRGLKYFARINSNKDYFKLSYAGGGVRLGDTDSAILSYRPQGSETYRVIYGDLSVQDVAGDNLPTNMYASDVPQTAKPMVTTDTSFEGSIDKPMLVSTPEPTTGPEMAPLPIKLPRPMFVGTPQDLKVARLEKPLGKPRPPFYAPVGTKNVAFGKRAASTDEEPIIGEIEMITDGDKEGSDGSYVELGPFKQHITIDLGAEHNIYAIVVWHFHKNPCVYFDVVVQISSEPNFVKPKTVFNNDIDNSLKFGAGKNMHYVETSEGKLIDAKGTIGRYVRMYSQGNTQNDLNHYIEVEVYGKNVKDEPKQTPDEKKQKQSDNGKVKKADPNTPKIEMAPLQIKLPKPMFVGTPLDQKVPYLEKPLGKPRPPFYAPVGTKNVAFEKPVSSTDEEPIIGEIELITDGDKEGADGSFVELGPTPQSIIIDLEAMHEIYAIVVWHYHKEAWIFFDVAVQVADDADFITNVRTLFNNDIDNSLGLGVGKNMHYVETSEGKLIDAKGTRARYLRLHSNGSNGSEANHYIEVEVYGKAVK
ncbi:MAG: hypothetical protein ACYS67_09805 [Planctomycetota bacterium]|jgi:hypothetical protein